ncbi:MAG: PIN domain-containing protein [Nocardioides sp.]
MPDRVAVLDTNVFGVGADLASPLWVSLRRLCLEAGITLCLPELVFEEAINLRREQYQAAAKDFLDANKKIARFFDLPGVYIPDADEVVAQWEADLRSCFRSIPAVAEDALEALSREASRTPPAKGGRGGRDALIWLTCRRLADDGGEVIFVSRNTGDFADTDGESLQPALAAELIEITGQLTYMPSLDHLFDLLATKIEGPDVSNVEPYKTFFGFDLWDFAADLPVISSREGDPGSLSIELSDLRSLRAYSIDNRGLALVDGYASVGDGSGESHWNVQLRFMAWVEFDTATGAPISAELERVTHQPPSDG